MDILRVTDWAEVYENNRTRELKRLDWVPMPNRMDGDGYTQLVEHPDGASHLGAWTAIVRIASRCDPRGTLLREGGNPHDPQSLARISRLPAGIFASAIPRFLEIGWLERIPSDSNTLQDDAGKSQVGAGIPQEGAPRARAFGTERTERNGKKETTTKGAILISIDSFPETLAAARRRFPSTDAKMAAAIGNAAHKSVADATDAEIAEAVLMCTPQAKKSAAFFIGTVPGAVSTIRARGRDSPRSGPDPDKVRDLWNRAIPEERLEIEQMWPELFHEQNAS